MSAQCKEPKKKESMNVRDVSKMEMDESLTRGLEDNNFNTPPVLFISHILKTFFGPLYKSL